MTFNDIFKSSFLEKVSSISVFDMILTILLSFGVGLFIFLVYKKTYRGVMYSAGFGTTLIALTMITATVILAVTSNVVLSLGMALFPLSVSVPPSRTRWTLRSCSGPSVQELYWQRA